MHNTDGVSWDLEGSFISFMGILSTGGEPKILVGMWFMIACCGV
jgi:hypothetical protein